MFVYDWTDLTEMVFTVEEAPIAEPGWSTSIACGATAGATVTLGVGDVVTCVVTNTFEAPTTPTVTTPEVMVTTTAPEAGVLGTTITAPPEVTSDTLPFTGAATGGLAVGGLLALIARMAALGVSPRDAGEEGTWSNP